ncbi:MAG TPA: alpha/beta fold hydrolase [Streptosporangiaceae bacterium]|nr:alpha/beta fold hydrolase [Streptosporangiaceae bacterium]
MTQAAFAGATVLIMVSYRQPGTVLTDRTFSVPLDHARPDGEQITIFGREVIAAESGSADLPWLVYLQGGPGFGSPRPIGRDGWLDRALQDYRVLLLDQRGTGRSTPATRQTLSRFPDAAAQARYLGHFRADSIVADAERIRPHVTGGEPWSVLGQSFGGFCTVTYLSMAPSGLREAFITGGLPGLTATADDVYRLTYRVVAGKNLAHYQRYPQDVDVARQVARTLAARPANLPGGGTLTVEGFQALGHVLGSSTGSATLHYLLEDPFAGGEISDAFLAAAEANLSYASAPLYALVHEACYAQGAATKWSAQRVRAEFAEFAPQAAVEGDAPLLFTGEMVFPWVFDQDPALRPLAEAADLLAERDDWPALYDPGQLARRGIPVAAAIYFDDMYVPRELSLETAAAICGLRFWITNEFEHDGLRTSDGRVLNRLIAMARDTVSS